MFEGGYVTIHVTRQTKSRLRWHVAPRQQGAIIQQFEEPLGARLLDQIANGRAPDFNTLSQSARLSHAREHHECRHAFPEQKIFVLRQEEYLVVLQSLSNLVVRGASEFERDDVLSRQPIIVEFAKKSERKVLGQENLHDTLRTAGGR